MAESALWKGIFAPRRKGAGRRSEPVPVAAPPPPPPAAALDLAALAAEAFGAGTGVPAGPPAGFNATNRLAALQANSTITTPLYMTDSDDGLTLALDPEWAKGLEDVVRIARSIYTCPLLCKLKVASSSAPLASRLSILCFWHQLHDSRQRCALNV